MYKIKIKLGADLNETAVCHDVSLKVYRQPFTLQLYTLQSQRHEGYYLHLLSY